MRTVGVVENGQNVYRYTHHAWGGRWGMKKVTLANEGGAAGTQVAALQSTVWAHLKPLVNHCAVMRYDDGSPRKPGWIVIKTMGPCWVVEVKDPDSGAKLVCVEPGLDDALAAASMLLEAENAPWEPDPWLQNGKPRRKGK